ncbi:MAG: hypothetical protein VKL58_00620 [Cyanobacteriota bacterium]|nr:hypothetical protein [Cyanobacteriota bacterium]
MGLSDLRCLLDIRDQIFPGRGEALVGLGFGPTLEKSSHHSLSGNFLAPAVEDLLLQLSNQGVSLIADRDGEL